jgi:Lon protease-like protein
MARKTLTRNGEPLRKLPSGDRRRISDFKNAWRKMDPTQRGEALAWLEAEGLPVKREEV